MLGGMLLTGMKLQRDLLQLNNRPSQPFPKGMTLIFFTKSKNPNIILGFFFYCHFDPDKSLRRQLKNLRIYNIENEIITNTHEY